MTPRDRVENLDAVVEAEILALVESAVRAGMETPPHWRSEGKHTIANIAARVLEEWRKP